MKHWVSILIFCLCGGLTSCADEDPLTAYDIRFSILSDCSQVASNAVQCVDEEELQQIQQTGRWIIEDQGGGLPPLINQGYFVATIEDGRSYSGLYFDNDGTVATESCQGEGGDCYFAQARSDSVDPNTDCLTIHQQALDFRVVGGVLSGLFTQTRFTDESCGTSTVGQVITTVDGVLVSEVVSAREGSE